MIVDDSGYQLLVASILIMTITLLRLLHIIPNYWGAMFSIYIFFGSLLVEVFNYYIPLSSWQISVVAASIIAMTISTLVVYTVYHYFVGGAVTLAIIAVVVMVCYMGQDGVNWFNGWLPHGASINFTVFVIMVLLVGLLCWILYEWAMQWDFLQYLIMTILIVFACSLCMDVFYELIVSQPNAINVLDFDFTYFIVLLITSLLYFGIEYLGNRYLPPPPKYCCCVCCCNTKKTKQAKKQQSPSPDHTYQAIPPSSPTTNNTLKSEPLSPSPYYYSPSSASTEDEETLSDLSTSYTDQAMNQQDIYHLLSLPTSSLSSRWSGGGNG